MNIDTNNIQNKNALVNLYESSLQKNENKLKIFDRLRKDTELLNSKLGMSGRQSVQASNMNTMSNNSKTKIINISADVKPFNPDNNNNISNNSSIKQINLQSRLNTSEVSYNPLMSQNSQSNQTAQFGYRNNEKNSYNDNYLNSRNFQNNNNNLNNNKVYTNTGNSYNNYNQNQNQSQNQYYDNMNNSSMYRSREFNNNNNSNRYKEDINTDINMSNNNRYPNQDNNYRNSNRNNYSMMQQSQSQYQDNNNPMFRSGNNTNNNSNNFNSMNPTNYSSNYTPNYLDSQTRMIMQPQGGQQEPMGQEQMSNNRPYKREPDEESNLSLFSTFKNSPLYKNRREICINVSIAFIVICFAIGALSLIVKFWDAIMDVLMDPRRLFVDGIFGFISSLFFGSVRYFYITIPLILLIIFLIFYFQRYRVKKICEEILKKIRDDLMNRPNNVIYQDDFYKKYAGSYGISEKEFRERYLPVLKRMRKRQDLNMKIGEERTDNGKSVSYWFLNN